MTSAEQREVMLEILEHIDQFCKANDITYFLGFGTLLGAVRHKGFIPWDDDVDVIMDRKNYDKFVSLHQQGDESRYKVFTYKEGCPIAFAKICDEKTLKEEKTSTKCVKGIDVDVFPFDHAPDDDAERNKIFKKVSRYQFFITSKELRYRKGRAFLKNLYLFFAHIVFKSLSTIKLLKKIDDLCRATNAANLNSHTISNLRSYLGPNRFDKEIFDEAVPMEFEGRYFPAPKGYDAFLKEEYGDYMQLPPIEKQVTHHSFKSYWRD